MAKQIMQFYYKSENNANNRPSGVNMDSYIDGTAFKKYFPISQLGVQALPGTKVYLNGSINPIIIGASGIYDLDMKNGALINDLSFGQESMDRIKDSGTGYLIVDILYGEED